MLLCYIFLLTKAANIAGFNGLKSDTITSLAQDSNTNSADIAVCNQIRQSISAASDVYWPCKFYFSFPVTKRKK